MRREYHRRSIRLREVDYSVPGWFFITICTLNRECLFGEVVNGERKLSELGKIAQACWMEIPNS